MVAMGRANRKSHMIWAARGIRDEMQFRRRSVPPAPGLDFSDAFPQGLRAGLKLCRLAGWVRALTQTLSRPLWISGRGAGFGQRLRLADPTSLYNCINGIGCNTAYRDR